MDHVPVSINVLEGEIFRYRLSNKLSNKIWGHDIKIDSILEDTVSYIKDRPIYKELQLVYKTGVQIEKRGHQFWIEMVIQNISIIFCNQSKMKKIR